jgi:hypothetical protein
MCVSKASTLGTSPHTLWPATYDGSRSTLKRAPCLGFDVQRDEAGALKTMHCQAGAWQRERWFSVSEIVTVARSLFVHPLKA